MIVLDKKPRIVVVGTRASALAIAQTKIVVALLRAAHPGLSIQTKRISTRGDRDRQTPLTKIGGRGIFVKEIENALLTGEIDIAVHSLKDMPIVQSDRLTVAAILSREDARDALVSRLGLSLEKLPKGGRVGTGSLRRRAQLRAFRSDLEIVALRGNVDTRLRKAATDAYDAVVLAVAGLIRLGRASEITEIIAPEIMLPAVGQGAICVEVRSDDLDLLELARCLDDPNTRAATTAERSFLRELGGGCRVPIAGYAVVVEKTLRLRGLVADISGTCIVRGKVIGPLTAARELGRGLAHQLLDRGGAQLLEQEDALG